ncbi:hypothetical protein AOLI_G00129270 [Acnodon oligacanthus]
MERVGNQVRTFVVEQTAVVESRRLWPTSTDIHPSASTTLRSLTPSVLPSLTSPPSRHGSHFPPVGVHQSGTGGGTHVTPEGQRNSIQGQLGSEDGPSIELQTSVWMLRSEQKAPVLTVPRGDLPSVAEGDDPSHKPPAARPLLGHNGRRMSSVAKGHPLGPLWGCPRSAHSP